MTGMSPREWFNFLHGNFYAPIWTWVRYGRHYETTMHPNHTIQVAPDGITHRPTTPILSPYQKRFTHVLDGDWDADFNLKHFSKGNIPDWFEEHFVHGVPWEETNHYERVLNSIDETGREWNGCTSKEDLHDRCQFFDHLYEDLKANGYKSQRELNSFLGYPVTPFDEVTVAVGRDGALIWTGGRHRLSLVQILDIDMIPVRIVARHESWQEIREDSEATEEQLLAQAATSQPGDVY